MDELDSSAPERQATTESADGFTGDVFAGHGDAAAAMRQVDWSRTPIGPVEKWSPTLKSMVSFMLANRFPILLWWGPDYIQLYNDAYIPVLGSKHPAMGQPVRECWSEIYDIIGPLIDKPFFGGPATWMDDILLEINRHGFFEETHFTIAYSPVPDPTAPRGIGGVVATVNETTEQVISERRVLALRDLGTRSLAESQTAEQACAAAAEILTKHAADIPFAAIYLLDADCAHARLAGTAGTEADRPVSPLVIDLSPDAADDAGWPVREALAGDALHIVERLDSRFGEVPKGPWSEPPHTGVVVPIASNIAHRPVGVLVAGVSPRHGFDEQYASFFELVTRQVATAVANARAYEDEKKRAEALAELDRAKTTFFSNVSHEFRTPLTLLLGPAEEALADSDVSPAQRERMTVIYRNAHRMQRLVNTLLDFSRIEAGRLDSAFEPTDLGTYTAELASSFRSAVEKTGLRFVVDAPPTAEPVYVDREMWEKIVLNLVSNALKHTFEGEIDVLLRLSGGTAELIVRDTGVGIPADQVPHLFERFHRVPNARSRTHEGTGIGLALVQELVRIHKGRIEVISKEGVGSSFVVTVPLGTTHLPEDRVGAGRRRPSNSPGARPFVDEALRWSPSEAVPESRTLDDAGEVTARLANTGGHERILVVDDNADMRDYIARLLRGRGWLVETAADGLTARDSARRRAPDLVLSDVMMPGLDGLSLVRELRGHPATADVPIILLSARAGEGSRVEGLDAGADSYLSKPFSARELLGQVGATLQLARMRREARSEVEAARASAEAANRAKSEFLAAMSHELRTPLNAISGYVQLLSMGVHGAVSDEQQTVLDQIGLSSRHLLSLITDILNFAKIEARVVEYDIKPVSLAEVMARVGTMVGPQLTAKGLTYETRIEDCAVVAGDVDKVQQILLNVLSNAIKFTPSGGRIRVDVPRRDGISDALFLRVADNGPGIPREKQDAIFEPFVQIDRALSRPTEGAGLGLAISRDLARGMGGDLRVRSSVGDGAAFTLRMPRN